MHLGGEVVREIARQLAVALRGLLLRDTVRVVLKALQEVAVVLLLARIAAQVLLKRIEGHRCLPSFDIGLNRSTWRFSRCAGGVGAGGRAQTPRPPPPRDNPCIEAVVARGLSRR